MKPRSVIVFGTDYCDDKGFSGYHRLTYVEVLREIDSEGYFNLVIEFLSRF